MSNPIPDSCNVIRSLNRTCELDFPPSGPVAGFLNDPQPKSKFMTSKRFRMLAVLFLVGVTTVTHSAAPKKMPPDFRQEVFQKGIDELSQDKDISGYIDTFDSYLDASNDENGRGRLLEALETYAMKHAFRNGLADLRSVMGAGTLLQTFNVRPGDDGNGKGKGRWGFSRKIADVAAASVTLKERAKELNNKVIGGGELTAVEAQELINLRELAQQSDVVIRDLQLISVATVWTPSTGQGATQNAEYTGEFNGTYNKRALPILRQTCRCALSPACSVRTCACAAP